ncbi:hypothetical protein QR680_018555 [Steinernema hermaphroditum]|uniref:Uncharacterized protein n=1 Tax=Steinernema hermaphroditum TaxID=289476 RepID=A0AA39HIB1_9BILA|nr:hypothetical protein QR680_018555 [Steinernema hermaphroditum]
MSPKFDEEVVGKINFHENELMKFLYIGVSLFFFGFISFGLLLVIEAIRGKRARRKAIEFYDQMIIPPRCEQKAIEINITKQMPWREYFYREQPFFRGAE